MRTATDTSLLFRRYLTQLLRNPVWLVVGFSTPILYLALFAPLLKNLPGVHAIPGRNVLDLFLPGILWMRVIARGSPLYYLVEASRVLAAGTLASPAVGQAFAVLVPLRAVTLAWATRVFRRAVA
jgi:hypothetical protein